MDHNKYYNLTSKELDEVRKVNGNYDDRNIKCRCAIHDKKPTHCKDGPILLTLMPGCGYSFEKDEDGNYRRIGECKMCGKCCALPRRKGDPYGLYDPSPLGKQCKYLIVEANK